MKFTRIKSTAFLATLLSIAAPFCAAQEHPVEEKTASKAQQKSHEQDRVQGPRPQPEHAQSATQKQNSPQKKAQPQQVSPEQLGAQRAAWLEHRAGNWLTNHRTWQERGGYSGYRIPDRQFHDTFGPGNGFHIRGLPLTLVDGSPRFQYGGYWVKLIDPWPEYWGDDWYETDEVYVNYVGDGYYLFNDRYPSAGFAVSISM